VRLGPRTSVCLVCRTVLGPGEPCDQGAGHQVVSLLEEPGRNSLVLATWGDRSARIEARRALDRRQQAGGIGAVAGLFAGVGISLALTGATEALPLAVGLVGSGIGWVVGQRRGGVPIFPIGGAPIADARAPDGADGRLHGPRGEIEGGCDLSSPASGTECIAYALELRVEAGGGPRTILRDAVTTGFTVHLDGGGLAEVPPGRLRILGEMQQQVDVDNLLLDDHLRTILPGHRPESPFNPLYHNVVCEQLLLPGDQVELAGLFEPTPSRHAEATMYRDAPPSILAPRGIPLLRIVNGRRS
jgi:hypothetical protein